MNNNNNPQNLPFGWIVQFDPSTGRNFYVDTSTGISYWHPPTQQQQQVVINEDLPAYEKVKEEKITNESLVSCPICSKKVEFGIINQHIESNCQLMTLHSQSTPTRPNLPNTSGKGRTNQGYSQVPQPYGYPQGGYPQQGYQYPQAQQPYQAPQYQQPPSSSRPNRPNRMNNAGLGLALGGGLLGGFLLGDMLGGDGGFF